MPAISKIRYTNVIYENGGKRYIDNIFKFEGYNGILLLENGGGKTVFVQTLLQAVLPHTKVAGRRISDTLVLNNNIAHIAVEWILNENPRRYAVTAVSLFINSREQVASCRFANEYGPNDKDRIEKIPFVKEISGQKRAAAKDEIADYYRSVASGSMVAKFFSENDTLTAYGEYLEKNFKIIPSEWAKIATINMSEGGVEEYFARCDTTGALVDRLLIPTVEEALVGGGTCDFVDLFEKQRIHFQKQIQLSARIQELSQVVEDLNGYNRKLKEYHDIKQQLEVQKSELKALYRYVGGKSDSQKAQQEQAETELQQIQTAQADNERALAALEVAFAEAKKKAAQQTKELAETNYLAVKSTLAEKTSREENLRYARARAGVHRQEEIIALTQTQLDDLDQDAQIADIKDRLDENAEELQGYFTDTAHRMRQELTAVERQIKQAKDDRQKLTAEQDECRVKRETYRRQISENEGQIKQIVSQLTKIEQEILVDTINETVAAEAVKWRETVTALETESESLRAQIMQYQAELDNCRRELPSCSDEKHSLELQQNDNKNKLQTLESRAAEIMGMLSELPLFTIRSDDFHGFYQREAAWVKQLEESVEVLRRQKNDALTAERRACRQLDDYQGQAIFTADAILAQQLPQWQESFTMLDSGTAYFQNACRFMDAAAKEIAERYPYWAATIVTTAAELDKAADFLQARAGQLTQAVILLTEQEAREICGGKPWLPDRRQIVPAYWENIDRNKFDTWLNNLQTKAAAVSAEKEQVEARFQEQTRRLQELKKFCLQYTYQEYQSLLAEKEEIVNRIDITDRKIENLLTAQQRLEQALAYQEKRAAAVQDEQRRLQEFLAQAELYFRQQKEHHDLLAQNNTISQKINEVERRLNSIMASCKDAADLLEQLAFEFAGSKERLAQLMEKEFYQEVQSFSPRSSNYTYEALADKRRALKAELDGRQKDRGVLVEKQQNARNMQDSLRRELEDIAAKAELPLDPALVFPEGGEAELSRLREELKRQKDILRQAEKEYSGQNDRYQSCKGAYENQLASYSRQYGELIKFAEELAIVQERLTKETERLRSVIKTVKQAIKARQKVLLDLTELLHLLSRKNELLHFTVDEVQAAVPDIQVEEKSPESLAILINEILVTAEQRHQAAEEKQAENRRDKDSFMNNCRKKIYDERMKQAVLTGIANKVSYEDFAQWHCVIRDRIAYSIRIAEGERKEHYTHIEQIIGQIHTYLEDVAEELKQIPKKTRIKIDEGSKEFYTIHVPEWKESDGKDIIRQYFNGITTRLEQPEFRDESGLEKTKEIRAYLERSLRTQQLLNQIIGEHTIRVKCRKVTNNNQLSIGTYTWEESCRWSGGEKWSKNMALFLGCLNYLSEKGKNVKMTKECNRVVIADNPFGQASSEHVLNPVFFIAKQLGFQFIALTAHDEGGFIRKYFPVVYSCRFAHSKDGKSQIIQTEKEIKTAFFQENNPTAMNRLADYELIGLF